MVIGSRPNHLRQEHSCSTNVESYFLYVEKKAADRYKVEVETAA
jgi:hypothetical protein